MGKDDGGNRADHTLHPSPYELLTTAYSLRTTYDELQTTIKPSPSISQSTFESTNERRSWLVSLLFHLGVMLLMVFVTCSVPTPPEELTEIQWGGGGGVPGLDAPVGETPQGDPDGGNRDARVSQSQSRTTPSNPTPNNATQRPTTSESPNSLPAAEDSRRPTETQETPSTSESNPSSSNAGTNNADNAQGSPDASGTKPSGGSGGSSVGVGNGNIGRCWERPPSSLAAGQTTTVSGRVSVTVTVKPDGRVVPSGTSVTSGPASLASRARSLAAAARACADFEAGDVTITLTYTFKAD